MALSCSFLASCSCWPLHPTARHIFVCADSAPLLLSWSAAAAFPANASQFANQSGQVSPTSGGTMATAQGYNATQGGQLYQGSCPVPLSQFPAPTPRCYDPKTHGQSIAIADAGGARKGTRASGRLAANTRPVKSRAGLARQPVLTFFNACCSHSLASAHFLCRCP